MTKDPLFNAAAQHGGAVEDVVGVAAEVQAGLVASQQPGAAAPAAHVCEDDLPTQLMTSPANEPWQDVLRRVPQGVAARGPQATLQQMFQRAGKGGSKGVRASSEAPGIY